jgi:hypothetical protein
MWAFGVVEASPLLDRHLRFFQRTEDFTVNHSFLSFPLKLSQYPFTHGNSGSM